MIRFPIFVGTRINISRRGKIPISIGRKNRLGCSSLRARKRIGRRIGREETNGRKRERKNMTFGGKR